jgi:predicted nucleic acid-binding protein
MPVVVVDTSVSLPATLSPGGLARKFWVLLAFGALTYEVEHRQLELDELEKEAAETGGRLGGIETAREAILRADDRRAALAELLPYGAPDDWVAVGSAPLFDEYERKLWEIGSKIAPTLTDDDIPMLRRQMEAVCVAGTSPISTVDPIPAFTHDPKDDPIVLTALLADADLLISDDKDIVPDRERSLYEHADHSVVAVSFNTLMTDHLGPLDVDWDSIDGAWLGQAYAQSGFDEPLGAAER